MGEPIMELGNKELEKIGQYVKTHIHEWLGEVQHARELDLVERVDEQFKRVDERF